MSMSTPFSLSNMIEASNGLKDKIEYIFSFYMNNNIPNQKYFELQKDLVIMMRTEYFLNTLNDINFIELIMRTQKIINPKVIEEKDLIPVYTEMIDLFFTTIDLNVKKQLGQILSLCPNTPEKPLLRKAYSNINVAESFTSLHSST